MVIGKHFEFESSHQLPDKDIYGKCSQLHGHTYKLEVCVEGEINKNGWIINFKDLKSIVNIYVIDKYDHQHLNQFFDIPTAEVMVEKIFNDLLQPISQCGCKLYSVKLYETSNSYAYIKCQ